VSGPGWPLLWPVTWPTGPSLPPLDNPGYEIAGVNPGDADSWNFSTNLTAERLALFGAASPPDEWEGFEAGWTNDTYLFEFDPLTDLASALFDDTVGEGESFEDFEEGWSSNETYAFEIGSVDPAVFASTDEFESFESGWDNDVYDLAMGSTTAALFDSAPEDVEDLEEGWANDAYDFTMGAATAAAFDGASPENFEDFEETYTKQQVAADPGTDKLTLTAHGFLNGQRVTFELVGAGAMPGGLNPTYLYFVVNKTANDFQVALVSGGAAVDLTDTGSGSTFVARDPTLYWNIDP